MGPQTQTKKALFFNLYGTLIDINTDENRLSVYETLPRYLAYRSVEISPEELKKRYFSEIQQHFAESTEIYPEVDVLDKTLTGNYHDFITVAKKGEKQLCVTY